MSADIYMDEPFTGKSGWSWYTGSADWMYQCLLHAMLGIIRRGDRLYIEPAVPALYYSWEIDYSYGTTPYHIKFENISGYGTSIHSLTMDGVQQTGESILLRDDLTEHHVTVIMSNENTSVSDDPEHGFIRLQSAGTAWMHNMVQYKK